MNEYDPALPLLSTADSNERLAISQNRDKNKKSKTATEAGHWTLILASVDQQFSPMEWYTATEAIKGLLGGMSPTVYAIANDNVPSLGDGWGPLFKLCAGKTTRSIKVADDTFWVVLAVKTTDGITKEQVELAQDEVNNAVADRVVDFTIGPACEIGAFGVMSSHLQYAITPAGEHAEMAADIASGNAVAGKFMAVEVDNVDDPIAWPREDEDGNDITPSWRMEYYTRDAVDESGKSIVVLAPAAGARGPSSFDYSKLTEEDGQKYIAEFGVGQLLTQAEYTELLKTVEYAKPPAEV